MSYDRDLTRFEKQNEDDLAELKKQYAEMSRREKIRHLGFAVHLSNRIARIEGVLRERRRQFEFPHHTTILELDDDTTTEADVSTIENE